MRHSFSAPRLSPTAKPKGKDVCCNRLRRSVWSQRCAKSLRCLVEFGGIDRTVGFSEIDVGFRSYRQHVKVSVGDFQPGDDERDSLGLKCGHLSRTNFAGNDGEMSGKFVREIDPMVNFESRNNEGVAGADRGDREECNAHIVSVNEPSRKVAVDDLGKQGAHGLGIVECNE